jgi:hypothetical protein
MYLEALAFYGKLCANTSYYWAIAKHYIREYIGPEPQQYYILPDGQVLPSSIRLSDQVIPVTHIYDPLTNRITSVEQREPSGRFRALRYLSMQITSDVGNIDISDWLGDIRANPVPDISPKQILNLWSLVHNQYIPQNGTTRIHITTNTGSDEVVTL